MNTKLHAVTDAIGRPIRFFMTAGQVSDYTGAKALVDNLPAADWLLGDRGYDADWFREGAVILMRSSLSYGNSTAHYEAQRQRHSLRAASRLSLKLSRE